VTANRPGSEQAPQRLLVLGANGPTGRLTVQQALDRGYAVTALTRQPGSFPIQHDRLTVIGGDATDLATIDAALHDCDAVISTIGTAYTRKPVEVYSASGRLVVDAMRCRGLRRLIIVTSMGAPKEVQRKGFVQTMMMRLLRTTLGRTLYDDMLKLEHIVKSSDLDWTIVRPPGLSNDPGTGYAVADTHLDEPGMARADLAAMLLDQVHDTTWIGRTVGTATPGLRLDPIKMIRHEVLKR
jgi:putative NADH-flavin reductase